MAKPKKNKRNVEKLKYEVTQELGIGARNKEESNRKKTKN